MPNLDKDFYLDKQGLRQLINELETNIVALEYDTTVSYTVGQYCVYENNFYRCTTATTGAWDSTAWTKVIISDELRRKVNSSELATVAFSGDYDDLIDKPTIPDEMVVLSYGHSNWQDFMDAYTTNRVVYCRASSGANPATGSQTRMAFMAYVNDATAPTSVEFQYYRSVSTHSATQQGDQVYIYKLEATNGGKWTVTVREAMSKIAVGSNMTSSYANGTITLDAVVPTATSELTNDSNFVSDASYVHTDNNFTTTLKDKLDGIEAGAEVNQNAFGEVQVGSTTISASSETDTLGLVGSNVTLTPDATNKEVTIGVTGANVTSALGYTPTNIQSITTAQWEALTPEQKASGDYVITDATTVPLTAENVPYDNTDSGLTADNVQEALDELSTSTNVDADDVNYDNTTSGLTADNVQDAIDELSQSSGASSVAQLEDVQLSNLSDNDLLVYDSNLTGGKLWKNAKKIVTCTKSQFDTWSANNSFPYTDCKYIVTDVNNINNPTASEIPYDNTSSGLSATSVQDAIDEVNDKTLSDGLHNITVETGFTFAEYMNYFKVDKLVIINIGGITHNATTASALVCQGLPVMRSRALGVVANDTTTNKVTLLYGGVGSGYLRISAHEANVRYYGQITYLTD